MSSAPATLDYSTNAYLAVTLVPSTQLFNQPQSLPGSDSRLSTLSYVGKLGELRDVHLFSVSNTQFEAVKEQVFAALDAMSGVASVDLQVPKKRTKRGGGEL